MQKSKTNSHNMSQQQQQRTTNGSNKTIRNRRKRQNRKLRNEVMVMTSGIPGVAPSVDNKIRTMIQKNSKGITSQGVSFLKCAFAPPDFAANDVAGYPDNYTDMSLVKKHKNTVAITLAASTDVYLLLCPTPGVSYWSLTKAAGVAPIATDFWIPNNYSDFNALFPGTGSTADIVTSFRFISNHIEVIPTVNQVSWTGAIQVIKTSITVNTRPNPASTGAQAGNILAANGFQAVNNFGNTTQYSGPFINGLYSAAYSSDSSRDFSRISEGVGNVPANLVVGTDFMGFNSTVFTGIDNTFDSVIIKISGVGTNTNNSLLIKTWACVEYKVVAGSALYEYQTLSPCDPVALEIYRQVIRMLPTAVTYMDNENFWQRVLGIIKRISGTLSIVPGPYGMMASGINAVSTGIEQLTM